MTLYEFQKYSYKEIQRGGKKVLANLKKALDMKGISIKAYAAVLGVSFYFAWNKVNEETVITYPEAETTKMELFPEYEFDYLFASDKGAQETAMLHIDNGIGGERNY